MSVAFGELQHPAERHPALKTARSELAHFDKHRERYERRDRVHHLTKIGMTNREISSTMGILERSVDRCRSMPPVPERPRLYDGASASDKRVAELESAASLTLHLAAVLHEEDPTVVWGTLIRLSPRQVQEIAVIALAAIPVDMTESQLLGWVNELPAAKEDH